MFRLKEVGPVPTALPPLPELVGDVGNLLKKGYVNIRINDDLN